MINILQIGCNSGSDKVEHFVKQNSHDINNVILIDPQIDCLFEIKKRYDFIKEKIFLMNCAIALKNGIVNFYQPAKDSKSNHSSLKINHVIDHRHQEINKIITPAIKINDLLKILEIKINFLFVDAEGFDYEIINSIDLKKYPIECIYYESVHTDGTFTKTEKNEKLCNKLKRFKYKILLDQENTVALKESERIKFR